MRGLVVLIAVILALASPARAQETINHASLSGRVTDPQGALVAGATVMVRQTATSVTASAITDAGGRFRFPYLRVGPYEITVTHPGFAASSRQLTLTVGSAFEIPFAMALESLTTEVTVSAEAPVLESARSQIAATVSEQEVRNLPLNGRNFLDIALLAPSGRRPTPTARSCSPRRRPCPAWVSRWAASATCRTASSWTASRPTTMRRG